MKDIEKLKKLREMTGVSVTECKKALEETKYDLEAAAEILKEKAAQLAATKGDRETLEGVVASYVHPNGRVGVLLRLLCETDFVAKGDDFQNLAHELCLQIAAMKPLYVSTEDVPEEVTAGEQEIFKQQLKDAGKKEDLIDQIVANKVQKYREDISLLSQPWIKDGDKTIDQLIQESIAKVGENITVKQFVRYEI